jgi:hypothetical protein
MYYILKCDCFLSLFFLFSSHISTRCYAELLTVILIEFSIEI